jgi:hypothetical protein
MRPGRYRSAMKRILTILLACAALATGLGACAPYIYQPEEFNRERADYGKELKDRTSVDICYFTRNTAPQDILAMAEAECAKFGKTARYRYSEVGICPLATPTLGYFHCVPR